MIPSMNWRAYILLASLALATAVPLHRSKRQVIDLDDPGASNLTANEVCFSENEIYQRGDIMPNLGPCEECKCEPPSIVCNMIKCPVNSGCRTIQRSNHCCPDYKCECEHNGEIYNNGERLDTPDEPCQVCYCKGGEVMCTSITCYHRDDCEPQYVEGQCCPKYDHCPLRDMPGASGNDNNSNLKNKTYVNSPKIEMQPWLLTKSVHVNAKPTTTSSHHNNEESDTDKPTEGHTEVIISDWLSERKTTTESVEEKDVPEKTTEIVHTTVLNLDSNIIQNNGNIFSKDHEESVTDYEEVTTISIQNNDENKNLQDEDQVDKDTNTEYPLVNTTNNPEKDSATEINVIINESKTSTTAFESKEELNIADLLVTTLSPETSTMEKIEDNINEDVKTTALPINTNTLKLDNVTELNKETESATEGVTDIPLLSQNIDSLLQNEETTNPDDTDGSGGGFIENENEPDRILHEELSRDFDDHETTKFDYHKVDVTTPIISEINLNDESNKKTTPDDEEIKENFIVVESKKPNLVVQETETPELKSTIGSINYVTMPPSEEILNKENIETNQNKINKDINKPLTTQRSIKDEMIATDDAETTTQVDVFMLNLQTTNAPEINLNLKEDLTKDDENVSEIEQNSSEDKASKVEKNSEEFGFHGNSNEEEGENSPPVLELNNQLPFLQLGGHGSSESSVTSEPYSSEVNAIENGKVTNMSNDTSLRTEPESNPVEDNKSNTSTHITLTPGDLKILAEYLINEKITPAERPSQNSSNYVPTEWLKGNLTSDVKIASILNAANISIEIMNKTNNETKIKLFNDGILNTAKIVDSKENPTTNNNENKVEPSHKETDDSSTISTKLLLLTDEPTTNVQSNDEVKNNNITQTEQFFEANTEQNVFETDIFETNTKHPENYKTTIHDKINEETTKYITEQNLPNMEDKSTDVSASRNVRIPNMESLAKEPFSVNLEDNDLTIVRDFLKKHMVMP